MRIVALDKESKQSILNDLLKRSPNNYSQYESTVNQIIDRVRAGGDQALFDYTLQFDKFALSAENIRVTKEEIAEAYAQLDENLVDVIRQSAENIRVFHQKQLRNSWFDAKTRRNHLRHEDHRYRESRCLCPRWKGSLSLQRIDECNPCESSRCR